MPDPADGPHSQGFGHNEQADDTRQAQHTFSNDTPVDVNPNAALARFQTHAIGVGNETLALMGKNFEANAMRFNGLLSHFAGLATKPKDA